MYIVVLAVMVSLAATGVAPITADDAWLSETGETFLVGQPGLSDTEEAEGWDKTEDQLEPEGRTETEDRSEVEGWNETGTQSEPDDLSMTGGLAEAGDQDANETQPIPVGGDEYEGKQDDRSREPPDGNR